MSFEGFSEADIVKLQKEKPTAPETVKQHTGKQKKVTFKIVRTEHNQNLAILNDKLKNDESDLPEAAKLQTIHPQRERDQQKPHSDETVRIVEATDSSAAAGTSESATKKVKDLNELQARQKLMEEQNKKRKELLAKALADRTRRTQEEAQRLNEIQAEFKKLDAVLSNDVKILRKQIDIASVDYMEAQKRYLRVEKEFLDAKLYLQQKLEKKEMLTEHLCAIIEKNEERKAAKLTELLDKLKLDPNTIESESAVQNGEVSSSTSKTICQ